MNAKQILRALRTNREQEAIANGCKVGYWLVRESDGERFYIGEHIDPAKLEAVANKALSDTDYQYWIDYCNGVDIFGAVAWSNVDQTDNFI